ncbi:DUF1990 domain-containing protein [Curtobacterium sp. MCPF17_011]|nr:DUF1990 domain-containing protein [Curtobacterium sp. MCBD17_030]PZE36656.1 DUF1990 domain-containing protein [Curtobacterium sp. MCPF17_031]PZE61251.1 DUF1990 domain-containing protein [Curtobacterium sp. MCPF17_001]PZF10691.1 DUF1990 domain-containing protein [Curtobacterium sp. MCPF17_011]
MTYPPEGFVPAESRARIGHGDQRFETAVMQALTWQIQERSGMGVRVEDTPEDDEVRYNPVTFDEQGVPIAPASIGTPRVEKTTPDGTPLITAGTTATLTMHAFGQTVQAPVRVVAIIDERDRKGFAYGTLDGHPLSGEESFVVERTPDGSVWLQVRQFSQPASRKWRFVAPLLRRQQRVMAEKYLAALRGD